MEEHMENDEKRLSEAHESLRICQVILTYLGQLGCRPEMAYAALGAALCKLHIDLEKGPEEWIEMANTLKHHIMVISCGRPSE